MTPPQARRQNHAYTSPDLPIGAQLLTQVRLLRQHLAPGPGRPLRDGGAADIRPTPRLTCMRAVRITRFGGPEVLDVVDLPDPLPGDGEHLYEVSSAGINLTDTHQALSRGLPHRR